nr:hypothetical protein GCM10017745_74910 [Saccharothrix mutabilis subsp. capreolus]
MRALGEHDPIRRHVPRSAHVRESGQMVTFGQRDKTDVKLLLGTIGKPAEASMVNPRTIIVPQFLQCHSSPCDLRKHALQRTATSGRAHCRQLITRAPQQTTTG